MSLFHEDAMAAPERSPVDTEPQEFMNPPASHEIVAGMRLRENTFADKIAQLISLLEMIKFKTDALRERRPAVQKLAQVSATGQRWLDGMDEELARLKVRFVETEEAVLAVRAERKGATEGGFAELGFKRRDGGKLDLEGEDRCLCDDLPSPLSDFSTSGSEPRCAEHEHVKSERRGKDLRFRESNKERDKAEIAKATVSHDHGDAEGGMEAMRDRNREASEELDAPNG